MKRLFCILLVLALAGFSLSGCDRRSEVPEDAESMEEGNFDPETTAVGGLTQAVEDRSDGAASEDLDAPADAEMPEEDVSAEGDAFENGEFTDIEEADQPSGEDGDGETADANPTPESEAMPFASPTPQPNASVSRYTEIKAPGLGFRFSYPTGWVNIPGRSTVCYVQPLEDGTVYPARVAVTMKRMPHATSFKEARTQLGEYLKLLRSQYDSSTFKVDTKHVDESSKFMGKSSIGTTYLAYDGNQEIKGYAVITYFERYLYVFHFLCAYNDFSSFEATIRYMRDSVQADASVAPK